MFFFFAVNGIIYFVVSLFIPETKGKTLEELEHLFDGVDRSQEPVVRSQKTDPSVLTPDP
jgi:hypothetical protein